MTPEITIRLATNEEGYEVARLAAFSGFKFEGWDLDWSEVYPYWIVAEIDGKLVGCVQVSLSKPVGRVEIMGVDPTLSNARKTRVVMGLLDQTVAVHLAHGAQAISSLIHDTMHDCLYFLEKHRDKHPIDTGSIVLKRIA